MAIRLKLKNSCVQLLLSTFRSHNIRTNRRNINIVKCLIGLNSIYAWWVIVWMDRYSRLLLNELQIAIYVDVDSSVTSIGLSISNLLGCAANSVICRYNNDQGILLLTGLNRVSSRFVEGAWIVNLLICAMHYLQLRLLHMQLHIFWLWIESMILTMGLRKVSFPLLPIRHWVVVALW